MRTSGNYLYRKEAGNREDLWNSEDWMMCSNGDPSEVSLILPKNLKILFRGRKKPIKFWLFLLTINLIWCSHFISFCMVDSILIKGPRITMYLFLNIIFIMEKWNCVLVRGNIWINIFFLFLFIFVLDQKQKKNPRIGFYWYDL